MEKEKVSLKNICVWLLEGLSAFIALAILGFILRIIFGDFSEFR